jgi:hypothetical protein
MSVASPPRLFGSLARGVSSIPSRFLLRLDGGLTFGLLGGHLNFGLLCFTLGLRGEFSGTGCLLSKFSLSRSLGDFALCRTDHPRLMDGRPFLTLSRDQGPLRSSAKLCQHCALGGSGIALSLFKVRDFEAHCISGEGLWGAL